MTFYLSVATTLAGLSTPIAGIVTNFDYVAEKAQGDNMLGATIYTGWEGRILTWKIMDITEFSALWIATGGDSLSSIIGGYIRCPDWGQNAAPELWGDYECVIERPAKGRWDRGINRYDIQVKIKRMERVRDSV